MKEMSLEYTVVSHSRPIVLILSLSRNCVSLRGIERDGGYDSICFERPGDGARDLGTRCRRNDDVREMRDKNVLLYILHHVLRTLAERRTELVHHEGNYSH